MRPFLLAFVDSEFFRLFGIAVTFLFALMAAVVAGLLFVLTRYGLRRWRYPDPAAPASSRLTATLLLLPAAFVGFVAFLVGAGALMESHQDHRTASAFQAALQRKTAQMSLKAVGQYVLVDSVLPAYNADRYKGEKDWVLADSAQLATDRSNHGRKPRVELNLRQNGSLTYHSNIVGDATGQYAAGNWHLEPEYLDYHTVEALRGLHNYKLAFSGIPIRPGFEATLGGGLSAYNDQITVNLVGNYWVRGSPRVFSLKKITPVDSSKNIL